MSHRVMRLAPIAQAGLGRRPVCGLLASALAGPALALDPGREIGYLVQSSLTEPPSAERAAFLDELARLGHLQGDNLLIAYRSAENLPEFLPDMAQDLVRAGALASYSADCVDLFRRSVRLVDRILRGASPANLPVEQPTRFLLVVNVRVARALGRVILRSIMIRADEVVT